MRDWSSANRRVSAGVLERVVGISAQEVGSYASHEQTSTEQS